LELQITNSACLLSRSTSIGPLLSHAVNEQIRKPRCYSYDSYPPQSIILHPLLSPSPSNHTPSSSSELPNRPAGFGSLLAPTCTQLSTHINLLSSITHASLHNRMCSALIHYVTMFSHPASSRFPVRYKFTTYSWAWLSTEYDGDHKPPLRRILTEVLPPW
jgi:hypothetical protein